MTISTSANPKFWISNLIPIEQGSVDFLSDNLKDLIETVSSSTPYIVKEGDNLASISYQFYNTTSLYYLILNFNGLIFWSDIKAGDVLQIPNLLEINSFFGRNKQQIGRQIRI